MTTFRISARNVIKFIILSTIAVTSLSAEIGLPQNLLYINDLLLVWIMIAYRKKKNVFNQMRMNGINYVTLFLILIVLIGIVGNLVPFKLILWGARNTFRGVLFFFFCVTYLKYEDVEEIFNIFVKLQYINFAIGLYQFIVLGLKQDFVGGIFGHGNGNALCIFCVIVCSYSMLRYFNEKKDVFSMIFCLISSIILAALAEEKFLFFEIVMAFILVLALSKKSYVKLAVIPIFFLAIQQGVQFFEVIFPGISEGLTSFNYLESYATASWLGSYYIPRIGSYTFISTRIFQNNLFHNLFGLGMGNCDTSSFSFLQSYYYSKYGYMNYRWIFQQWTIMEEGIIGFWCFIVFFIIIIFYLLKVRKCVRVQLRTIVDTSIITALILIMTMWMNNTLKVDTAYIPYFAVAAGFVCYRTNIGVDEIYRS